MDNVETVSTMIGSKVSIHTNEGTYTGVVSQLSDPPSKVVLSRVACVDNGGCELRLPGLITILDVEIISFDFVNEVPPAKTTTVNGHQPQRNGSEQNGKADKSESVPSPSSQKQITQTRDEEQPRLHVNKRIPFDKNARTSPKRPDCYIVVETFGETFDEAISMVRSSVVVGFCMDGLNIGRNGQLCWIHIATKETVILFDMMALGCKEAFDSGLGQIMESTSILKIMHDCRQVSDILQHKFRIGLNNVYDTQVADIMVYRKESEGYMPKYVRNLGILLMDFVGLTQEEIDFYYIRKSALDRNPAIWKQRPLSSILLQSAALSVRYLRELRLATLEVLLSDLVEGVGMYLNLVRDSDDIRSDASNGQLLPKEFLYFGPLKEERSEGRNLVAARSPTSSNDTRKMRERYVGSPVPTYDKNFITNRSYENQSDVRQRGDGDDKSTRRRSPNPPQQLSEASQRCNVESRSNHVSIDESRNIFRRDENDRVEERRNTSNVVFYPA